MDIFIGFVGFLFMFISALGFICGIGAYIKDEDKSEAKVLVSGMGIIFFISTIIFMWPIAANKEHWRHSENIIVNFYDIQLKDNQPYYFDKDNYPHALYGDAKFIDTKKFKVKEEIKDGGWELCMYVTGNRSTTYVPKE
jgi:hypothetical protein